MKKAIRVLLVFIIVGASFLYLYRWEEGPEQRDSNSTIIYKRDRWTNIWWVKLYGSIDGQFYSGDERPVFSDAEIDQYTKKQLSNSDFLEIQSQIESEKNEKESYELKLIQFKDELTNALAEYKKTLDGFYEEKSFDLDIRKTELVLQGCDYVLIPSNIQRIIDEKLSSSTVQGFMDYCANKDKYYDVTKEFDMQRNARDLAVDELTSITEKERRNLTFIWTGSLVAAVLLFFLTFIRRKNSTEDINAKTN